ncbi:MAG: hypothetical protein U0Y10_00695 [Spirosomataceae bacterium]
MNRKYLFAVALSAVLLGACDYQKNNTIKQADLHAGDTYVYGVHPDSAARQTKNKYTENPDNEARTQKIREKLTAGASEIAKGN